MSVEERRQAAETNRDDARRCYGHDSEDHNARFRSVRQVHACQARGGVSYKQKNTKVRREKNNRKANSDTHGDNVGEMIQKKREKKKNNGNHRKRFESERQ